MPTPNDLSGDGQMAISDLLLGLSGVLLIVLAVASTRVQTLAVEAGTRLQDRADETESLTASVVASARAAVIAGPRDLRLIPTTGAAVTVPQGALSRDTLAPWLARLQDVPLLIVLPGGDETAFLTEPLLAAGGVDRIDRLRLTADCVAPQIIGPEVRCASAP